MSALWLALPGLALWALVLILPWRPWSTRESLNAAVEDIDLSEITVIIPARNEEDTIATTLASVIEQGNVASIILVDDQSTDQTSITARNLQINGLRIIQGEPAPAGWSGKLWALEQGKLHARTEYVLLLDADICLLPGILACLLNKATTDGFQMVSIMAALRMQNRWEKLLMPAFIYFFKLLYPFSLSNSDSRLVAAAAGGCILIERDRLEKIGGFTALKDKLIDDCALARKVKESGGRTWTGLSRSVLSHRPYPDLQSIWAMVGRTAYTQLHYSVFLLLLCTLLMVIAFILPFFALASGNIAAICIGIGTFIILWGTYIPVIRYYAIGNGWALGLPFAGIFFLLMTWTSAFQHWHGTRAVWKDRVYHRTE